MGTSFAGSACVLLVESPSMAPNTRVHNDGQSDGTISAGTDVSCIERTDATGKSKTRAPLLSTPQPEYKRLARHQTVAFVETFP